MPTLKDFITKIDEQSVHNIEPIGLYRHGNKRCVIGVKAPFAASGAVTHTGNIDGSGEPYSATGVTVLSAFITTDNGLTWSEVVGPNIGVGWMTQRTHIGDWAEPYPNQTIYRGLAFSDFICHSNFACSCAHENTVFVFHPIRSGGNSAPVHVGLCMFDLDTETWGSDVDLGVSLPGKVSSVYTDSIGSQDSFWYYLWTWVDDALNRSSFVATVTSEAVYFFYKKIDSPTSVHWMKLDFSGNVLTALSPIVVNAGGANALPLSIQGGVQDVHILCFPGYHYYRMQPDGTLSAPVVLATPPAFGGFGLSSLFFNGCVRYSQYWALGGRIYVWTVFMPDSVGIGVPSYCDSGFQSATVSFPDFSGTPQYDQQLAEIIPIPQGNWFQAVGQYNYQHYPAVTRSAVWARFRSRPWGYTDPPYYFGDWVFKLENDLPNDEGMGIAFTSSRKNCTYVPNRPLFVERAYGGLSTGQIYTGSYNILTLTQAGPFTSPPASTIRLFFAHIGLAPVRNQVFLSLS